MLAKAELIHLRTLETLQVSWNPAEYTVEKQQRFAAPPVLGSGPVPVGLSTGGTERFRARLFLDSTDLPGPERDLRRIVDRLEGWAEPEAGPGLPPRLLFHWGTFRFRGVIESLREEWVHFDADGTPVRAWVDLTLRR